MDDDKPEAVAATRPAASTDRPAPRVERPSRSKPEERDARVAWVDDWHHGASLR